MKYEAKEVEFENPDSSLRLSGTLILPVGDDYCPIVVLIHGQGPMDRDQAFMGKKPFRTIATYLANSGIGSLRYDKRGVGKSSGEFAGATVEDFATDVESAVKYLAEVDRINPSRIGVLGISEGGLVASKVASRSSRLAFCVMMAAPVMPGRENLALSFSIMANGNLSRDENFVRMKLKLGRLLKLIAEGTRTEETRAEALAIATEITPLVFNENTKVILGGIDQLSPEQFIGLLASPCFEDNLTGEQAWHLRDINCPTLALYGSRDVQVPAKEHIETVGEILGEDSTHDFRVVELPFANHLFQRCETGFPREYFSIDHDIAPDALEVISEWITRKMKPDNNFDMRYRV